MNDGPTRTRDWAAVLLSAGLAASLIILCATIAAHPILLASSGAGVLGTLLGFTLGVLAGEFRRGQR